MKGESPAEQGHAFGSGGVLQPAANPRRQSPEALASAIRAVHGGTGVMSEDVIRRLAGPVAAPPRSEVSLSVSERDVLRLLCKGYSNAAIAAALFLSESTVKLRLTTLGDKLGTTSRVTTAIRGWELGLAAGDQPR